MRLKVVYDTPESIVSQPEDINEIQHLRIRYREPLTLTMKLIRNRNLQRSRFDANSILPSS